MSSNPHSAHVVLRVKELLKQRNLPQAAVADRLHLSQQAVSRRLAGEVEFSIAELSMVAELLDTEPAVLVATAPTEAVA